MVPKYEFKVLPELGWAVFVAVVVALATSLLEFEAASIDSWETWGIGVASGLVRAAAGAVLAALNPLRQ